MTTHWISAPTFEFEAFSSAVALAVMCGALSTALPLFIAPTATLAALALAGWASMSHRRGTLVRTRVGEPSMIAFGLLAAATTGFLVPPSPLVPFRALILSCGLLPLFITERLRFPRISPVFGGQ